MGRRKKRSWSDEERREICQQTAVPGVSVAQVARRYAVNANLIFKWLKDPRFAPAVNDCDDDKIEAGGLARGWALEMAHRCDPENHPKGSLRGKTMLIIGVPICRGIGRCLEVVNRVSAKVRPAG